MSEDAERDAEALLGEQLHVALSGQRAGEGEAVRGLDAAIIVAEHLPSETDGTASIVEVAQRRKVLLRYLAEAKGEDATVSLPPVSDAEARELAEASARLHRGRPAWTASDVDRAALVFIRVYRAADRSRRSAPLDEWKAELRNATVEILNAAAQRAGEPPTSENLQRAASDDAVVPGDAHPDQGAPELNGPSGSPTHRLSQAETERVTALCGAAPLSVVLGVWMAAKEFYGEPPTPDEVERVALKRILNEQDTEWAMDPSDMDQRLVANHYAGKLTRIFSMARAALDAARQEDDRG